MTSTSSAAKVALLTGASSGMAKPLMFIRKYFGDRVFDTAIMSQAK